MKYITIVAKDFESAVKKARGEYGQTIRIHSRRDTSHRGGLFGLKKIPSVELMCYLVSAPEAAVVEKKETHVEKELKKEEQAIQETKKVGTKKEEIPIETTKESLSSMHDTLITHARYLCEKNQFSHHSIRIIEALLLEDLNESKTLPSKEEFELMVVDKIVSLITIDHETQLHPPHFFIILGPTGTGKTTSIAKIGALYALQSEEEYRKSVHFVTLDDYRVGAADQLKAFGNSLNIQVDLARGEQDMYRIIKKTEDIDVVLVDTVGRSPKDKELLFRMNTMLSLIDPNQKKMYIALSGSMKTEDIVKSIEMYSSYPLQSIIITKVDETESIGNIISVAYEKNLPILFFTDGQHVPVDIHKASTTTMLSLLKGFSLDFESMWENQSNLSF